MRHEFSENSSPSKSDTWERTLQRVESLVDKLGKRVDSGIKETVTALKCAGFDTDASCEGHLDSKLKAPWVDLVFIPNEIRQHLREVQRGTRKGEQISEEEARLLAEAKVKLLAGEARLLDLLDDFYEGRNSPNWKRLVVRFHPDSARLLSQAAEVQDLYVPNVRQARLKEFQHEIEAFTEFLKQRFLSEP